MGQYLVTGTRMLDGQAVDIEIEDGRGSRVCGAGEADVDAFEAANRHDVEGQLVTPNLTESHIHHDATPTAGDSQWNESSTLSEGIDIWAKRKRSLTKEGVKERDLDGRVAGESHHRVHADARRHVRGKPHGR